MSTENQTQSMPTSDPAVGSSDLLEAALEAVLLFHAATPWDAAKRQRWDEICGSLLPDAFNDYGLYDRTHGFDATTRVLCDLARVALGRLPSCFGDFKGRLPSKLPADLPLSQEQRKALERLASNTELSDGTPKI